ncbi:MAG: glycosyltransferase [Sulfuricella sp.]|nr:glycosyltransferase [Sulfuricella sp.]
MSVQGPKVVAFTTVFPHSGQPDAGLFVRERVFRVGQALPLTVVAPVPWFAGRGRWFRSVRPEAPPAEKQAGFDVLHPRFLALPGVFKPLNGLFLALSCFLVMLRLKRRLGFDVIDAHCAYPDGYAAVLLGKWLGVPATVTLCGPEAGLARNVLLRSQIRSALARAARVFAVSDSLRRHALSLGIDAGKIRVVGNGVDLDKFHSLPQRSARRRLGLPPAAPVLVSVGGSAERKGFRRVIDCLAELRRAYPDLCCLVVGGGAGEGDGEQRLRRQAGALGLGESVVFLGAQPPEALNTIYSAADVFVLATRDEGCAGVFLEAMACGLPVVTIRIGGHAELVCRPELGTLVPFGDSTALGQAIADALGKNWDRGEIMAYAAEHAWDERVAVLIEEFRLVAAEGRGRKMLRLGKKAGVTR